jgi:release factor glutamine methyltransferase
MTYSEFIDYLDVRLSDLYVLQERRAMAVRLLCHFCGISCYEHLIEPSGLISSDKLSELYRAADQLAMARPLQYVLGFCEFSGLNFHVEGGVLIPRPETEELVRWIGEDRDYTDINEEFAIFDAGCGSGCIGIALANLFPNAKVFMCDISDKAIEVSKFNCRTILNKAKWPRVDIFKYDLLGYMPLENHIPESSLDIIVSNPPYVRESEKQLMHRNILEFEPSNALFVSDKDPLLFYRVIAERGRKMLKTSGKIYFEINEAFGYETMQLLQSLGYENIELKKDLNGRDRMVRASSSRYRVSRRDDPPHAEK